MKKFDKSVRKFLKMLSFSLFITTIITWSQNLFADHEYFSGNDFLKYCKRINEIGEDEITDPKFDDSKICHVWLVGMWDGIAEGAAIGYATALQDQGDDEATAFKKTNERNTSKYGPILGFCLPEDVKKQSIVISKQMAIRIVYKYILNNPEQAADPASALYISATRKAYPCK